MNQEEFEVFKVPFFSTLWESALFIAFFG